MSEEQQTGEAAQGWGAEQQPTKRRRWSGRRTVAALGIAVVLVGGGGAAVYAATGNDSGSSASGPGAAVAGAPGMGGGGPGGAGALGEALHGEFVVADGSTELLQTGEVTAISATSISLTSDDGYAQTYTIDSDTVVGDIQTGDEATVIATDDSTAISVTDQAPPQ